MFVQYSILIFPLICGIIYLSRGKQILNQSELRKRKRKKFLKGKKATCFTGFEKDLLGANVINAPVVSDGNIVTAYGAGAAFLFGFRLLERLTNALTAEKLKQQMRVL